MPYNNKLAKYYDAIYQSKDYKGEVNFISNKVKGFRNKKILDVGCGTGTHSEIISKLSPASVLGVDLSSDMISQAQGKVGNKKNLSFEQIPLNKVMSGPFDVITSLFHVINHIPTLEDLQSFLKLSRSLLAPGGFFIFDCYNAVAMLQDAPRCEKRTIQTPTPGHILSRITPRTDWMSSTFRLENEVKVFFDEDEVDFFSYGVSHRIWLPATLSECLEVAGFSNIEINPAFCPKTAPSVSDYKIVFTCHE